MSDEERPSHLAVATAERGACRVVTAAGEIDLMTAPMLAEALAAAQADGAETVADLRQVTFMDSTGVRVLLEARDRASATGTPLRLALEPDGRVERLLRLAGIDGLFGRDEA